MNKFFDHYAEPLLLLGSIVACLLVARAWRKRRHPLCRRRMVAFFYWGPIFLIACMIMHTANNLYGTVTGIRDGSTVFTFHHYSVYLFGAVLGYQSWLLLYRCREHVEGTARWNKRLYALMAWIIVTTLPTFHFTPIGFVPSIVLLITFAVSVFVHRPDRRRQRSSTVIRRRAAALLAES